MVSNREAGKHSEILGEVQTSSMKLELRRTFFTEKGESNISMRRGMLELALDGRPATGELYFKGSEGRVGGAVGQLVYVPPSVPFEGRWGSGVETSLCCFFSPKAAAFLPRLSDRELASAPALNSPRIVNLMMHMREELERRDVHHMVVLEGLGLQLAGLLARHFQILTYSASSVGQGRVPHAHFEQIIESLHGRRGTPTMMMVADELGYSEGHFGRLFQATVGLKFSDYVMDRRMRSAEEMLRTTTMSINDIASELGYDVPANFSRAFRRNLGVSPREFRGRGD